MWRSMGEHQMRPEDIKTEVKTPTRIYLEQALEQMKSSIISGEEQVRINKLVLKHIEKRIGQEIEKLK